MASDARTANQSSPSQQEDQIYDATTTFSDLYESLLTRCRADPPLLPPVAPFSKTTTNTVRVPALGRDISNLSLHPTLETALYILSLDLPSAHFLARHMQCPSAWEGMFLHGILHRIEGDYDNSRARYGDVKDSEVFAYAWMRSSERGGGGGGSSGRTESGIQAALALIADVQTLKEEGTGDRDESGSRSLDETQAVVAFCAKKFGVQSVDDARGAWTKSEGKIGDRASAMVVGGEGWREFYDELSVCCSTRILAVTRQDQKVR
jgi:hypothetical protein